MPRLDRRLVPVISADLRKHWETIKPGIEACKSASADDWIAEDVYHALKSGQSFLYVGYENSSYVGFLVLTPLQTYADRVLHIWLAYSETDRTFDYLSELDGIAKALGISRITHTSPRKGWQRIDAFEAVSINYSRRIT